MITYIAFCKIWPNSGSKQHNHRIISDPFFDFSEGKEITVPAFLNHVHDVSQGVKGG